MSPRPKRFRKMGSPPVPQGFQPFGVHSDATDTVTITYEEFEALKLADYENLPQEKAAVKMGISRPTFTRIYTAVRKKIALAFVKGKTIRFEGGKVSFNKTWYRCRKCHHVFSVSNKKAPVCPNCGSGELENVNLLFHPGPFPGPHGRGPRLQRPVQCICPDCGTTVPHIPGQPCNKMICPSCNHYMRRL